MTTTVGHSCGGSGSRAFARCKAGSLLFLAAALGLNAAGCDGCAGDDGAAQPLASAESVDGAAPTDSMFRPGTIIAAETKDGRWRLYKVLKFTEAPPPLPDELEMVTFNETAPDVAGAKNQWLRGGLTVAVPTVRVTKPGFQKRRLTVIGATPVTEKDTNLRNGDRYP